MTRRPAAARAGPIRHQIRGRSRDAVEEDERSIPPASPQAIEANGIPAAIVVVRSPGSGSGLARTAATSAGRSVG